VTVVDTNNDGIYYARAISPANGGDELTLSRDGERLVANSYIADGAANAQSTVTYVDHDTWLPLAVYGQKLTANGSLLFQPLTDGIDILDGSIGLLRYRLSLPIQIPNVYDSLVADDNDGLLFAITTNGIAQLDLRPLWFGGNTTSSNTSAAPMAATSAIAEPPAALKASSTKKRAQPTTRLRYVQRDFSAGSDARR